MRRKTLIRENKYLTEALSSQALITLLCMSNLQRSVESPGALDKTFMILAGILTILNVLYILGGRFASLIAVSKDRRRRERRKNRKDRSTSIDNAGEILTAEEKSEDKAEEIPAPETNED